MPFQKQSKATKESLSLSKTKEREPLLERIKKKTKRGIRKGILIAGLGLALIAAKPAISVAQDVLDKNVPKLEETENRTQLRCYFNFKTMMHYFTPEENLNNNNTFKAMFDGLGKNKFSIFLTKEKYGLGDQTKIIAETDTIEGFNWNKIINAIQYKQKKEQLKKKYNLSEEEYNYFAAKGRISLLGFVKEFQDGSEFIVNFGLEDKLITKNESVIEISFNDNSNRYFSVIQFPNEFDILDVKPFFGRKTSEEINFGTYIIYKNENKIYEMIAYIFYDIKNKKATTYYILREYKDDKVLSMLEDYK